ncbi:MAG TPA: YdeI/OmpD-associated family protein [Verrucomicrobiae bacterium]|nr:YdeI/OmpD-associated family protein [Verrucomicrobiae bacterium]
MSNADQRVDAYIADSADYAKPILEHLRKLVHQACPQVEETIKWRFPCFMHQGMLCSMAAFKQHCTFGFWKHSLIIKQNAAAKAKAEEAMGHLGRITSLSDLPSDKVLIGYVKQAVQLNEQGVKLPRPEKPKAVRKLVVPPTLVEALKRNKKAQQTFENFSPSHKREYIEWITEAKREETRDKRLTTTISWLAQGKPRNWKYMNC